jgi:hypothetical protein
MSIVAIDDASIAARRSLALTRSVHATLMDKLRRPAAPCCSTVLSEPDPDPPRPASHGASRAAPVVMPVLWQALPRTAARSGAGAAACRGATGAPNGVDADGVLRHALSLRADRAAVLSPRWRAAGRGQKVHAEPALQHLPGATVTAPLAPVIVSSSVTPGRRDTFVMCRTSTCCAVRCRPTH